MKMKDKYVVVFIDPFYQTCINTFDDYGDALECWNENKQMPTCAAGAMVHYIANNLYEPLKQFADGTYFDWEKED